MGRTATQVPYPLFHGITACKVNQQHYLFLLYQLSLPFQALTNAETQGYVSNIGHTFTSFFMVASVGKLGICVNHKMFTSVSYCCLSSHCLINHCMGSGICAVLIPVFSVPSANSTSASIRCLSFVVTFFHFFTNLISLCKSSSKCRAHTMVRQLQLAKNTKNQVV